MSRGIPGSLLAAGAIAVVLAVPAQAQRAISADMTVTAVVVPNCRLTIDPLTFGTYDPLGANDAAPLDATSSLILTCTRSARASISMGAGHNAGNDGPRTLVQGSQRLIYQLFRDAARTKNWGSGAMALSILSEGLQTPSRVTVYGRVPAGQEVAPGTYSDLVTATVDF